jgi:hypothetical protein
MADHRAVSTSHFGTLGEMRRTVIFLACAVAVVGGACSSSSASIPPPHSVEKSAAINAGDGLCKSLAADQKQLIADFKSQHPTATADEARDFLVNTLSPRIERMVGDFHRIGEPTKDKADWDQIVIALDQDLSDFKSKISADPIGLLADKPFAGEAKAFTDYGFKECQTQLA